MRNALQEKGFFDDDGPKKLIICGDLFDRGSESEQLLNFILELMEKGEVILVRGNHEDLLLEFLDQLKKYKHIQCYHNDNGTVKTVRSLTGITNLRYHKDEVLDTMMNGPVMQKIIPAMVNYFETNNYVFVHGWIPLGPNWRNATTYEWSHARWANGMDHAHDAHIVPGKTVVCGHWHASYGHCNFEHNGPEFGVGADFSPYYADGIIAIDACTAYSGKVNCIVIEDETTEV